MFAFAEGLKVCPLNVLWRVLQVADGMTVEIGVVNLSVEPRGGQGVSGHESAMWYGALSFFGRTDAPVKRKCS